MKVFEGNFDGKGLKIAIVASRFNEFITKELIGGAEDTLLRHNVNTDDIEALLAKIDSRLEQIQGNSEILDKIYNLLKDIDWTNPDYSAKLDRIIEILENFKCNCECGGNNEGIIGDLEDVLNG